MQRPTEFHRKPKQTWLSKALHRGSAISGYVKASDWPACPYAYITYRHLLAWRGIDGVWTGIIPLKLKISSYKYPRTCGQGLGCNKSHIVVPWVGVPGWLSPIVLHSQPAKSTCSTSDILMKGCTWRKDKRRCKQVKCILKYRQVHSPLAVSSQLSQRDSWSNCNEEPWQFVM